MLKTLIELCDDFHLCQKINFGTRPTPSGGSNTLDLLFTNNHLLINNITHRKSALSDHVIISCETTHDLNPNPPLHPPPNPPSNLSSYNLNQAPWNTLNQSLNLINWQNLLRGKNSEDMCDSLNNNILDIVAANCRKYKSKPGQNNSKIPRDRRIIFRQIARKLHKKSSPTTNNRVKNLIDSEVQKLEKKLIASYMQERLNEEKIAIKNIKSNPKHFFTFARKHKVLKEGVGPLKENDTLITSPKDICEALSKQYSSVYSSPDPTNPINNPENFFTLNNTNLPSLLDINFNENTIVEKIATLKNNSAPGPDHFPVLLLKNCKKELSKPLYIMFRHSLDHADIAPIHKHGIICPVLKPNSNRHLPKSYRPISLTSHIIKIFEKIISSAIIQHLSDNNLLPTNQHGFLKGRSTLSQLLNQIETITKVIESGQTLDTVYLDFAKAFDKVDHKTLYNKIKELRIGGKVGVFLYSFLNNRTQQVAANGAISSPSPVISGVPQGTVLGPILFIIMIYDLDKNLNKAFAALFADDSRVSTVVTSPTDAQAFQTELDNKLYPWAPQNKATFNGEKFEHMHFGRKIENQAPYLDPSGNPIAEKQIVKDLGVWISNDLSWNHHIDKIISDSKRQAAWILRTFTKRDKTTMRTLWMSLIRPILDYCSPLWSPSPTNYGNIDRLEGVLRGFSKHVDGLENLPYNLRLHALNLQTIQRRHERYKILYLYKIKEGLVPNLNSDPSTPNNQITLEFKPTPRIGTKCFIPGLKLYHNPGITHRNNSFALTACNLWNCLPTNLSKITNYPVDRFKHYLDLFLDLFPDEPRCCASGEYYDPNTGRLSNSILHMKNHNSIKSKIASFQKKQVCDRNIAGEGLNEVIPHP